MKGGTHPFVIVWEGMSDLVDGGFVLLGSREAEKAMLEAERTRKGVLQMKRGTCPLHCHLSGFGPALPGWNNT